MSILIDESTKLTVQGITGRDGFFHTMAMQEYGTNITAGITPGKGGRKVHGVPVFDSVKDAISEVEINTSIIYVPALFAADAIYESIDAGVKLIVCITEGIPVLDMLKICSYIKGSDIRLLGGNCPGLISPGKCKVGIMPAVIHKKGNIGIISRSGTLTYEVAQSITEAGLGQSTVIGIGGDSISGTGYIDLLEMFEKDEQTDAIAIIGEIGGTQEEQAAEYIKEKVSKPVFGFIAGKTAPRGKRMGHAGAIIDGGKGTAADKIKVWNNNGIKVLDRPDIFGQEIKKYLFYSQNV
ncbi:MAG: succinate--CoA ligase subunit alpha [Victivallales bacterium]|nr:succinate--CoA ligase subunit alpha [Victivallales bacterium]MCF7888754.1 succinate--CoA ligase subunit alpha [Victivallales bacterium]